MDRRNDENDAIILEFKQQLSGMSVDDLREVSDTVLGWAERRVRSATRPDHRRPPFDRPRVLRIRAELDNSDPLIWRELDVRADLTLDVVHMVMEAAFGWSDSHLYRFASGGHAFDARSQLFLCPYDADNPDVDVAGCIPAHQVRIDELLQQPGDTMAYLYDYGDSWEVTIRLIAATPAPDDAPEAVVVAGERAAPPEDSRGGVDLAALSFVVDDPSHFDRDQVQHALRSEILHRSVGHLDPRLSGIGMRLLGSPLEDELHDAVMSAARGRFCLSDAEVTEALRAHQWFLNRASEGGIPLTSAGYMKPADVEAASAVVPRMADWIGMNNRESLARPLLHFRTSLQKSGLLRKYKGVLVLTRRGVAAQRDPQTLWDAVVAGCVVAGDSFEAQATLLVLTQAASAPDLPLDRGRIIAVLNAIGWRASGGATLSEFALIGLPILDTLANIATVGSATPSGIEQSGISEAASVLARAALRRR